MVSSSFLACSNDRSLPSRMMSRYSVILIIHRPPYRLC
jgi:hypothetical protein